MKKIVSILAIVLAFTMMMSLTSFAAASFEIKENAPAYEGTTVTPAADSIAVTTATTAGNYYGVLLVEGNTLPTVDTDILYIDQVTADATSETFNVLPIIPEANTDVTLYISSNVAGAGLISVPMAYAEEVPAGPAVTFMNGAETVATLNAVDGAVVAPAAPANVPTPGADALITKYEFVGWTDADGTATYEVGDSVPVAAEMTLYAKYQMYYNNEDGDEVVIVVGDITGDGRVKNADAGELVYFFEDDTQCGYVNIIGIELDPDNTDAVFGDITADGRVKNADAGELVYFFEDDTQCGYTDSIGEPLYFVNIVE